MRIEITELADTSELKEYLKDSSKSIIEWTHRAARGEVGWICPSCCCSDESGMPNECFHGQEWCTKIIKRDKMIAQSEVTTD